MMRLVKEYHTDLVQSTHLHLASQLEQEGNYHDAEKHFIAAEDWKAAVNMYRSVDMWEEAYRVRRGRGGRHDNTRMKIKRSALFISLFYSTFLPSFPLKLTLCPLFLFPQLYNPFTPSPGGQTARWGQRR